MVEGYQSDRLQKQIVPQNSLPPLRVTDSGVPAVQVHLGNRSCLGDGKILSFPKRQLAKFGKVKKSPESDYSAPEAPVLPPLH